MVKLKSVGAPSRYRVEMYETGKQNAGTRIGTFIRRYQPEIFPLYKSYAGGAGVESVVDKRQNVLGRKSLWVLAGVVLLVGLSGAWFAWRFLHHGVAKSKGGAAASAASSVSAGKLGSAAAAAPAVASTPDVSEAWREVGRYSARGVSYVVLVGEKGRFRVESPSAFMQPVIAVFVATDIAELRADQLARAQAGCIAKVQQESQPLRGCFAPAVRPLEAVSERADQQPLAFGEAAGRVQSRTLCVTLDLDAGERICEHIALRDQPAKHRREDVQSVCRRAG